MSRVAVIITFVAVVCVASVGFVLFYNPIPDTALTEVTIQNEPVALGAETIHNTQIVILVEGQGTVEVSPYKTGYAQNETVKFIAHPLDGWVFDRWEGDVEENLSNNSQISVNMLKDSYNVTAVFVEK